MILSLFSGCGGLDLGFEMAGYETRLAFDLRPHSISSWNRNRVSPAKGLVADIRSLDLTSMDSFFGSKFTPSGVIGGPPCQSFTRANANRTEDDPRSLLVHRFFSIALDLHRNRRPLDFIVMENVTELERARDGDLLKVEVDRLKDEGFEVHVLKLNAKDYGVPQNRHRLFVIAVNRSKIGSCGYVPPEACSTQCTVRDAIGELPDPVYYRDAKEVGEFPVHPNHWCMTPQSRRFFDGSLKSGQCSTRSFKTLAWDKPSIAVSYGHREVHVHPRGDRRLSVFEAMLLQGFPDHFVLDGTLSAQIDQVSEAVPPPLALAIAKSVKTALGHNYSDSGSKSPENSGNSASALVV